MKVVFRISDTKIQTEGHFTDKSKCSALTTLMYYVINLEVMNGNIESYLQEDGKTMIEVKEPSRPMAVLKSTLMAWTDEFPNDIRVRSFID
jgi:hypothetical protein